MKQELGQVCECGNGKWKREAGTWHWAHLVVAAGLSQSPVWSLLTSLGIGALMGDEVSVCAGVTLSRRMLGRFFDVCVKGLGIFYFFHPQKQYNVVVNGIFQTHSHKHRLCVWCLTCKASLKKSNKTRKNNRNFFFSVTWPTPSSTLWSLPAI